MKKIILLILLLTGCASQTVPEGSSYIRFSKGEYGASLLQWVGVAAEGDYCMLSSSETNYEFTTEDVEFFKVQCPPDTEAGRLIQVIQAGQN